MSTTTAPAVDLTVMDKLISDAPDDLEFEGADEDRPERAEGKFSDLSPEDFDASDDDDDPEKPAAKSKEKPEPKAAKPKDEPKAAAVAKEPAEDARPVLPRDRGTEDKPWTVKDLPEDGFIQIKVDGKSQTLSLKEAVSGYIRTETFHAALTRANNANEEATQIASEALQEREQIRQYFQDVFKTPKKLFDRLMQDPEEMLELGQMIAGQYVKWQKGEESLQDHKIALRERRLAAREQAAAQAREQHEQQQRMTTQQRAAVERWRPVHQEALKENGFPKLTPQFQKKFAALFRAEHEDTQGKVTPEAYKALFKEALLLVGAESTVKDRKPPPQADPPRARREAASNGASEHKKSYHERIRDYRTFTD